MSPFTPPRLPPVYREPGDWFPGAGDRDSPESGEGPLLRLDSPQFPRRCGAGAFASKYFRGSFSSRMAAL